MRTLRNSLAVVVGFGLLLDPVVAFGQENPSPSESAREAAESDARRDVAWPLWLGCGCLFLYFAPLGALLYTPSAPADRLVGKSPDYVIAYTGAYRSKIRSFQVKYSLIGCFSTAAIALVGAGIAVLVDPDEACQLDCGESCWTTE